MQLEAPSPTAASAEQSPQFHFELDTIRTMVQDTVQAVPLSVDEANQRAEEFGLGANEYDVYTSGTPDTEAVKFVSRQNEEDVMHGFSMRRSNTNPHWRFEQSRHIAIGSNGDIYGQLENTQNGNSEKVDLSVRARPDDLEIEVRRDESEYSTRLNRLLTDLRAFEKANLNEQDTPPVNGRRGRIRRALGQLSSFRAQTLEHAKSAQRSSRKYER